MINKIIYISYTRPDYSLNSVCIKGLRENGVEVFGFHVKNRGVSGLIKAVSFCLGNSKNTDLIIVGYDTPALVIFLRFFTRKKIIYNAALSVYERMIVSRELASRFSVKAFYYWFLDFVAVHLASLVMVETNHQADYFKKIFKVSGGKLYRNWIGVNEENFFHDSSIAKSPVFTVLFRGALMPEAGAEYIVQVAKVLEDKNIKFIMHAGGMLLDKIEKTIKELGPNNLELTSSRMPFEELRVLMQKCHLSLGQLANHPRIGRTIPHKAYESLSMKLPYLTASNAGILELLVPDETCLTCNPADAKSLAEKILWAKDHPREIGMIAENGYKLYQTKLKSEILAKNLLDRIETI